MLRNHYKDWEDYKERFKRYGCSAGVTNEEEERIRNATINYQMLQSLTDVTDEEVQRIAQPTIDRLESMCSSVESVKSMFGITPYNQRKTAFQRCVDLYPSLLNDEYAKVHLRRVKDGMVKRARAGKLDVRGKYTFILPDFYAACEHWFLGFDEPTGLLRDDEVFCWLFRLDEELDCLRSPHLMLEHYPATNLAYRDFVDSDNIREWFCTNALYTSCHSFISRVLQFDVDGDKSLVVADRSIIDVAKRNIDKYDVVPLYYDMRKAEPVRIDSFSIYDGLHAAFVGGNIGIYSNNISKIWNSDTFVSGTEAQRRDAIELIKLLCMENNYTIDYAKTLYKPVRPDEVNERIARYTNSRLPHFFKYAKDKGNSQVVERNMSFVNRLEDIIPNPRISFKKLGLGPIDYTLMMHDPDIGFECSVSHNGRVIESETDPIIVEYCRFDKATYMTIDSVSSFGHNRGESYARAQRRVERVAEEVREALSKYGRSVDEVTDILVKYLYGIRRSANKTILWLAYGDVIYRNLSEKMRRQTKEMQCVDCGEWFEVHVKAPESKALRCPRCRDRREREVKREQNKRAYDSRKKRDANSVGNICESQTT